MRGNWFGAVILAGAAAVTVPAGPDILIARFGFNARSGTAMDESGHGHVLVVVSAHGGTLHPVPHGQGTAIGFPDTCTKKDCPHVVLQSPSTADLNPGTRDIAFGADVLLPPKETSHGENLVQKGFSRTGSQWKLQIDGLAGHPSCVLVGDQGGGIQFTRSSVTVADAKWHSVQCHRIGTTLSVYVDGVERGRIDVPATLSVTNDRPLSIGGKGVTENNDQFSGALDNVWVAIG